MSHHRMTIYRTRLAQNGTLFFHALRELKKARGIRATARKVKVAKSTVSRWFQHIKPNPCLALTEFALKRIEKRERKQSEREKRAEKPQPTPRQYVKALIRESTRLSNGTFTWARRTVRGWLQGKWLEIEGERTPTGKQKRKMRSRIEKYSIIEPSAYVNPLPYIAAQ